MSASSRAPMDSSSRSSPFERTSAASRARSGQPPPARSARGEIEAELDRIFKPNDPRRRPKKAKPKPKPPPPRPDWITPATYDREQPARHCSECGVELGGGSG